MHRDHRPRKHVTVYKRTGTIDTSNDTLAAGGEKQPAVKPIAVTGTWHGGVWVCG